ncbi:hypothetical protein R1flu_026459 [Riccia fluitans]|uniref:Uncharacterized protein n=1 Tax=Riccia fluitans TaxID=41844 RepID=A0ABD1XJ00_9MARC
MGSACEIESLISRIWSFTARNGVICACRRMSTCVSFRHFGLDIYVELGVPAAGDCPGEYPYALRESTTSWEVERRQLNSAHLRQEEYRLENRTKRSWGKDIWRPKFLLQGGDYRGKDACNAANTDALAERDWTNPSGVNIFVDLKTATNGTEIAISQSLSSFRPIFDNVDAPQDTSVNDQEEHLLHQGKCSSFLNEICSPASSSQGENRETKNQSSGEVLCVRDRTCPFGFEICLDLGIPSTGLGVVPTSPPTVKRRFCSTSASGYGGREVLEPNHCRDSLIRELSVHLVQEEEQFRRSDSLSWDELRSPFSSAEGENDRTEKLDDENDGHEWRDEANRKIPASVLKEKLDSNFGGCLDPAPNRRSNRSVHRLDSQIARAGAAPERLLNGNLNEDDVMAACQLLMLSYEDVVEGGVDEITVANRLLELSDWMTADEEEEFVEYTDDILTRSTVGKISAEEDLSVTDLAEENAFTTSADENLVKENYGWGDGNDMLEHAASDLRAWKLKRIKPDQWSSDGRNDRSDEADLLDRPPHKRQYKSLQHIYYASLPLDEEVI